MGITDLEQPISLDNPRIKFLLTIKITEFIEFVTELGNMDKLAREEKQILEDRAKADAKEAGTRKTLPEKSLLSVRRRK
jgi:hypothetical protein